MKTASLAGAVLLASLAISACAGGTVHADTPPVSAPSTAPASSTTLSASTETDPETQRLARRVGTWDVVMTLRTGPNAAPIVTKGMIAERTMMGRYLNEVMRPAPGSSVPDFRRIDHMTFDPVQGRWAYASLDTRAPIGIMFARGWDREQGADITVYFDNFADPGIHAPGASTRARHVDTRESDDHELKRQYWTQQGQPEWLAVQYEYTRKR